jgi:molecular chaperone HscB
MLDFSKNHFELFGLQPRFGIDADTLDRAYRDLQTEIHPDRFAHAGEAEQRLAVQWATRANEAYKTLKDPFERAKYLLELCGIHAMDARNTTMPAAFLMQQMAWRESLAEALAAKDNDALQRLEQDTRNQARQLMAEMAILLDERQDYPAATEALRKYRFLDKFLADIDDAYEEIG